MKPFIHVILGTTIIIFASCKKDNTDTIGTGTTVPTASFIFVVDSSRTFPIQVSFTSTANLAKTYLWDFKDGTTSTLQNPKHTFNTGGIYNVTLTVTNDGSNTLVSNQVAISPYLQAYTSFNGPVYNLYAWEGNYVTFLMRNNNLDPKTMQAWATTMDKCYLYYKFVTGRTPSPNPGVTFINGHTTIADVSTTCGAGCGYLGATGMEMQNSYTDRMYNYILTSNQYDQELFYEFGRNFWFYGDQLAYKANDPVATGYAVFMRFMSMDATKISPAPFNTTQWLTFRSSVEGLVDTYQSNSAYNWNNTLGIGQGISNPLNLGATDLIASMLIRLKNTYGGDSFVNNFWKQAGLRPKAQTTQDAVDNFFLAACATANKNLTVLFNTTWKWPLSDSAKIEASKYQP